MTTFDKLPKHIAELLQANKRQSSDQFTSLIGEEGYIPPNDTLMIDAITTFYGQKHSAKSHLTGSGKTKFGETLSALFNQPMFSINCSVDLDAESLLGFKTLQYKDDRQEIEFVPGPVTEAMLHGTFLYIDEINMAMLETLPLINGVLDYRRKLQIHSRMRL